MQYRLARAGEVVSAGQRILTILDLNDVYMTIYLPADQAGKLTLGDEARTILDPFPQYVFPQHDQLSWQPRRSSRQRASRPPRSGRN